MISGLLKKIFGSRNDRLVRQYLQTVRKINALEPEISALSDDALRGKTAEFRQRVANGEALDALLPEAFAVVREAGKRVHGMRHFDVQLVGGMVLHNGKIAEMRTGEGKTLVATLPAYLNALSGKGVHVITVNDYLASRDAEWMGRIYGFLGLTTGCNLSRMAHAEKQAAYAADITYGTNNEFGFDYLRDNMKFRLSDLVQRPFNYAVVDEVDSILIDEARTPLIISGPSEGSTDLYQKADTVVRRFAADTHFKIDEKSRAVSLLEEGVAAAEKALHVSNLYDLSQMDLVHGLNQALKAHFLFKRDVDYMVKDGQVIIVDEFTGRLMPGRRYSDGLHQALEAKERVRIEQENQTLASITFQNYFRMYKKLAGMTGTAATEAEEFRHIYGLDVVEIPTNKPLIRIENPDVIYRTAEEKWNAVQEEIVALNATGRRASSDDVDREIGALERQAPAQGHQARRPQRQVPRAGGRDHRPGRPVGSGDDRDQHGRPRRRYSPRRKSRGHRPGNPSPRRRRPGQGGGRTARKRPGRGPKTIGEEHDRIVGWADSTFSAPSVMKPAASTTSSAAGPGARAIPDRPAST